MPAIIRKYQSDQVEQAVNPVAVRASQTSLGELGQGLSDVGGMFDNWQDEIDTADAKAADSAYSDLIRQELYADQTGFMYSQGGDAVNRRGSVTERLEAEQQRILDDLSPSARRYAASAMEARRQRALQTVDQYTAGQRRNYLNTASEARLVSTVQDAIFNPDLVAQSIATADQELSDLAAREGWSPEVLALKRQEARTEIHSGIIGRLEAADPIRALEYLRANRSQMTGSEVARLEGLLVPAVREYRGRQAGAAAAGQVDPSTFITYRNQGAKRNDPLNDRLVSALNFLPAMGVRMEVISGGQETEAELRAEGAAQGLTGAALTSFIRSHRTGSVRHDHGNSADVDFFLADGTKLVPSNPDHRAILSEIVGRAQANGVTGFGEGSDYMGEGRIHIGFGSPAVWGADGKVENAPEWLVQAYSNKREFGALPPVSGGIESLLEISDPDERAAAINEYKLRTGVAQAQTEARRQQIETAAFEMIEAGGNINDLPLEYRQSIGREAMNSLRIYNERIASGRPIQTDDVTYVQLADMMARDPEAFMSADPMTWRDRLDDGDFQYFVKQRSDMMAGRRDAGSDAPSVSTLRTAAKTALSAAGFSDNDEVQASFESNLLRWSSTFSADQGRAPTPLEMNDRINQMLVPIVIDPSGLRNKQTGRLFQMDYDGSALDPNDDVTPDMLRDGALRINDVSVSNEMIEIFANGFNDRFGRAPTVQELVEGMTATGLYE